MYTEGFKRFSSFSSIFKAIQFFSSSFKLIQASNLKFKSCFKLIQDSVGTQVFDPDTTEIARKSRAFQFLPDPAGFGFGESHAQHSALESREK